MVRNRIKNPIKKFIKDITNDIVKPRYMFPELLD